MDIYSGDDLLEISVKIDFRKGPMLIYITLLNKHHAALHDVQIILQGTLVEYFHTSTPQISHLAAGTSHKMTILTKTDNNISRGDYSLRISAVFKDINHEVFMIQQSIRKKILINSSENLRRYYTSSWEAEIKNWMNRFFTIKMGKALNHIKALDCVKNYLEPIVLEELTTDINMFGYDVEHYLLLSSRNHSLLIAGLFVDQDKRSIFLYLYSDDNEALINQAQNVFPKLQSFHEILYRDDEDGKELVYSAFLVGKYCVTLTDYISIDWHLTDVVHILRQLLTQLKNFPEFDAIRGQVDNWIDLLKDHDETREIPERVKNRLMDNVREWQNIFEINYSQ